MYNFNVFILHDEFRVHEARATDRLKFHLQDLTTTFWKKRF